MMQSSHKVLHWNFAILMHIRFELIKSSDMDENFDITERARPRNFFGKGYENVFSLRMHFSQQGLFDLLFKFHGRGIE